MSGPLQTSRFVPATVVMGDVAVVILVRNRIEEVTSQLQDAVSAKAPSAISPLLETNSLGL
jgi:hypothetical protein